MIGPTCGPFGLHIHAPPKKRLYRRAGVGGVFLHTCCATALASTPSLKSLLIALQMGLEHKKELPWEWRRSTAGNGVASCPTSKKGQTRMKVVAVYIYSLGARKNTHTRKKHTNTRLRQKKNPQKHKNTQKHELHTKH